MRMLGFRTPIPEGYFRTLAEMCPLNLNFLQEDTFDERITFTRSSGGGRFNANGEFEWLPNDVPRIDYDPVTGECLGLLIEAQRTNLLPRTEVKDGVGWSDTGTATTTNLSLNALGQFDGASIATGGTATDGLHSSSFAATEGTTYCATFLFRYGTAATPSLEVRRTAGGGVVLSIRGEPGSMTASTGTLLSQRLLADGETWEVKGLFTAATTESHRVRFSPRSTTPGETLIAIAAQVEAGAFPTSLILSEGSATTRARDYPRMPVDFWNPSGGAVYVEYALSGLVPSGFSQSVFNFSLASSTGAERFWLGRNTAGGLQVYGAGGSVNFSLSPVPPVGSVERCAIRIQENNYRGYKNGVRSNGDASATVPSPNHLEIANYSNSSPLNGHIRRLQYFRHPLSDNNLQWLTTP